MRMTPPTSRSRLPPLSTSLDCEVGAHVALRAQSLPLRLPKADAVAGANLCTVTGDHIRVCGCVCVCQLILPALPWLRTQSVTHQT